MKIVIELEQHELQLAHELISTLKSITDQLQVRTTSTVGGREQSTTNVQVTREQAAPTSTVAPVVPTMHGPPGFVTNVAQPHTIAPSAANNLGHPPPSAVVNVAPYGSELDKRATCRSILLSLTDNSEVDAVAGSLANHLSSRTDNQETVAELTDAFESVVFSPQLQDGHVDADRVERYFQLLAHKLPDTLDAEFRKGVLQRVLKQLTKLRELTCDKAELVPFAVGFAALVRLECVKVSGALATIERLISKSSSCAAAVTMLGKVLSTCSQLVWSVPAELGKVWHQVDTIQDLRNPVFAQDMEFLAAWRAHAQLHGEPPANMQYNPLPPSVNTPAMYGSHQANGSAAPYSPGGGQGLVLNASVLLQLKTPGVCMAWDAPSDTAIISCADSSIVVQHVASCRETGRLEVSGYPPVSSISSHPTQGLILLAANPQQQHNPAPYLALHDTSTGMPRRGVALRQAGSIITRTLLLPGETDVAVSCESWGGMIGNHTHAVCLWDINRMEAGPSHSWTDGHTASVTSSTFCPGLSYTFFTGAQDGVVRIWDTRMRSAAGALSNAGIGKAHTGNVCMDSNGHMLITGGSDSTVCMWDLRQLSSAGPQAPVNPMLSMVVEGQGVPIYKLAYRDSPSPTTVALATGSGLYMLDWTVLEKPTMLPTRGYQGRESAVLLPHDITWAPGAAHGGGLALLALNGQATLTVFSLQSTSV